MSDDRKPCPHCGRRGRFSVLDEYQYVESGLENVYLQDVETVSCDCGESVVLKSTPSLLRSIAFCFAYKPAMLRGRELRFIRHVIGRKARDFAQMLSISPEYLSRLENEVQVAGASLDKLVRARLQLALIQDHPEMAGVFDLKAFEELLDSNLPSDDRHLALYVKTAGSHVKEHERIEFEFKEAA